MPPSPSGTKTRPRFGSADRGAPRVTPAPVVAAASSPPIAVFESAEVRGMGSKPHSSRPVRASKPHRPVLHIHSTIVADGGPHHDDITHDGGWRGDSVLPFLHPADSDRERTVPRSPKSPQSWPVAASSATSSGVYGPEEDPATAGNDSPWRNRASTRRLVKRKSLRSVRDRA